MHTAGWSLSRLFVGMSDKPSTAALCHLDLPLYLAVSPFSFFPPPLLALPLLYSSLISLHLPHYFLPSPGLRSPLLRLVACLLHAADTACFSICTLLHLSPFTPLPRFMTGYENTGAWYPKQINKERQKSHSNRLTRTDFPADC